MVLKEIFHKLFTVPSKFFVLIFPILPDFLGYNEIYIPIQTIYRPYRPYKPNNEIYIPTPNSTYITTDLIQTSQ